MALREAMADILERWDEISPRLEYDELATLATGLAKQRSDPPGVLLTVFAAVEPALLRDDPAWELLRVTKTRRRVGEYVPEDALAQMLFASVQDAYAQVRREERHGQLRLQKTIDSRLLALERVHVDSLPDKTILVTLGGERVVPAFQFESTEPPVLLPLVASLYDTLHADTDPRGALMWWLTVNPWVNAAPVELLGQDREEEIVQAAGQLMNDNF